MRRDFWVLWQGQLMSQLGTQAFQVLALYWLASQTGSASAGAAFMALGVLPPVLLGPWLASYAKRWPAKKVLVGCDGLSAVIALPVALALWLGAPASVTIVLLLITTAMLSTVNALMLPVLHATVPTFTAASDLPKANSWMLTTQQLASVAGQGLGGAVYALAGPLSLCLLNSVGFLLSSLWSTTLTPSTVDALAPAEARPGVLAAVRVLRQNTAFCWLASISALFNLLYAPWLVLLPFHLAEGATLRPQDLGISLAAYGAGSLVGAALMKKLIQIVGSGLLGFTLLGLGAGLIILGSVHGAPAIAVALAFLGAGIGIANVQTMTRVQTLVEPKLRAEAIAVLRSTAHLATPVGFAIVALCHQVLNMSPGMVYQLCGGLLLLGLLPVVRKLTAAPPAAG